MAEWGALIDVLVGFAVIAGFFLLIYSKMFKKNPSDVIKELTSMKLHQELPEKPEEESNQTWQQQRRMI